LYHRKAHLYRSALEGICFSIAQMLDIISGQGFPLERIMIAGGGTKNPVWMQMAADILNQPLRMTAVNLGACYGDALLAALGSGVFSGFEELEQVLSPGRVFMPNSLTHKQYKPYRQIFDQLYPQTKELMHRLDLAKTS
jgi:xylulokinase